MRYSTGMACTCCCSHDKERETPDLMRSGRILAQAYYSNGIVSNPILNPDSPPAPRNNEPPIIALGKRPGWLFYVEALTKSCT